MGSKSIELKFEFKKETKTCYRFETGEKPEFITLYLKKSQVDQAGIDPNAGITVSIRQDADNK